MDILGLILIMLSFFFALIADIKSKEKAELRSIFSLWSILLPFWIIFMAIRGNYWAITSIGCMIIGIMIITVLQYI
jgi:hypothetical protein